MSAFEILSIAISVLALVISAVSLVRARRLGAAQLELEKANAELAKKQLENLVAQEVSDSKAHLDVDFSRAGTDYILTVTNIGAVEARDVTLELQGGESLFAEREYQEKFPMPLLRSGKSIRLLAGVSMGGPRDFSAVVAWFDPDGSPRREHFPISF